MGGGREREREREREGGKERVSTTEDYIKAEDKLQSISQRFIKQRDRERERERERES